MYLETIDEKAFRSFLSNPAISVLDVDALPPLTEWDSRSLQQKMVGGFSSQSR